MILLNNLFLIITILVIWFIFNNLKFNLAGVRFLQGDHQFKNKDTYSLLFNKPKNPTKTELLKQLNDLKDNKPVEPKEESLLKKGYNSLINYLTELLKLFNLIKEVMYKLTFISFFIKLMYKYKIFRQIILIIRKIIFLGFGSSFLNYFGFFDFFHEIWVQIQTVFDYLIKLIKIYLEWLNDILTDKKEEIETPEPDVNFLKTTKYSETNKSIDEEVSQNWTTSKIIMITSIIVISCFIYVYFDEIKDFFKPTNPGSGSTDISNILDNDEKIELIDQLNKKSKDKFNLPGKDREYFNDPLKDISEMTSDHASSSKTTLEDLPKIAVTDSSGEIIYYEVTKPDNLSSPTDSVSSIETIKPLNWRSKIDQSTKEAIEYVEKHFPDSEFDDINYIKKLIEDVNKTNMNLANKTINIKDSLSANELAEKLEIAKKTETWVNDMFDRLKSFE